MYVCMYVRKCLYLSDTFACHSAQDNLFLTLRIIHKLKRPQKPETGIKGGFSFKKWNMNSIWNIPTWKNRTTFLRHSIALEIFPLKQSNKSCSIYFPIGFSGNFLNIGNNHLLMENWLLLLFGLYNNNKFIQ